MPVIEPYIVFIRPFQCMNPPILMQHVAPVNSIEKAYFTVLIPTKLIKSYRAFTVANGTILAVFSQPTAYLNMVSEASPTTTAQLRSSKVFNSSILLMLSRSDKIKYDTSYRNIETPKNTTTASLSLDHDAVSHTPRS